jgi:hypothetical protein
MKAKASRLTTADPHQKVDSSTWTPGDALNTEAKTGLRPISRRAFKKGGKVMGTKAKMNLGKSIRGSNKPITPDNFANKDVKAANEDRPGIKHVGALKTGGRAKKQAGGSMPLPVPRPKSLDAPNEARELAKQAAQSNATTTPEYRRELEAAQNPGGPRKSGGRTGKALGGTMAGAKKMLEQGQETSGVPAVTMGFSGIKKGSISPARGIGLKKGGTAKHDDAKQDMALIKKMVKSSARKGKMGGGSNGDGDDDMDDYKSYSDHYDKTYGPDSEFSKKWKAAEDRPDDVISSMEYKDYNPSSATQGREKSIPNNILRKKTKEEYSPPKKLPYSGGGDYSEEKMNKGGKAKRAARKDGGGIFTGTSYPGKIPGVVPGGREARATGGKTKGKTNINIVIAAGKPAGNKDMMGMPPGMDGGPQGMPIPVPPPSGGLPMGGGAPMPMPPMPAPGPAAGGPPPMPRKSGGRLTAKASSYKDMTAGSAGGEGRLQKTDIAEKHKGAPTFKTGGKVYRSYKDMDAGSASGLGRLEKTEIQKRKG